MKNGIRFLSLLLCLSVLAGCFTGVMAAQEGTDATILFTHDLHSHFLPAVDEDGGEYGGYARLMTAIRRQRAIDPNAILVDGGDFAMGTLFQTAYPTDALELRLMGAASNPSRHTAWSTAAVGAAGSRYAAECGRYAARAFAVTPAMARCTRRRTDGYAPHPARIHPAGGRSFP